MKESVNTKDELVYDYSILWGLVIPVFFLVDVFISDRYSATWFWIIITLAPLSIIGIFYMTFHPREVRSYMAVKQRRELADRPFDEKYNDLGEFEYEDLGFSIPNGDHRLFMAWTDIAAIFIYKRDLMTVDQLNIDLFFSNNQNLHLTEDDAGWYQLIEQLKKAFPTIAKDFDRKVVFPPFETNLTLVYETEDRTLEEAVKFYYRKEN